jgi:hypothetical protein
MSSGSVSAFHVFKTGALMIISMVIGLISITAGHKD